MAKKNDFGKNWWATQFNQVLENMGWQSRLQRGRTYARKGAVLELSLKGSKAEARVQGTRPKPYQVEIEFQPLSNDEWSRVITAMAGQALFAASLLSGEMPRDIETVFTICGVSLFPRSSKIIQAYCSCPDIANPCKHIAAVYYLLGQRFDEDPFLLFELRGMPREQLLTWLSQERQLLLDKDNPLESTPRPDKSSSPDNKPAQMTASGESLLGTSADFMLALMQSGKDQPVDPQSPTFWKSGALPEHRPEWVVPSRPALLLQRQDPPPAWKGPNFINAMSDIYQATSENGLVLLK